MFLKLFSLFFFFFFFLSSSNSTELMGKLEQGGIAYGWAKPGEKLFLDKREISIDKNGFFIFGLGRNAKPESILVTKYQDGTHSEKVIEILKRDWIEERVNGLPSNKVSPNKKTLERIRQEGSLISIARKKTLEKIFFLNGFMQPSQGRISGVFGSQRILNGLPRSPHSGLDIAAPVGTPVRATADGIVSLVHEDMVLTGKTIIIDHGMGLNSVYIHLNDIYVKQNQSVLQGDKIATIGMTGRTTGPHLHFGISWYSVKLDPQTVMSALPLGNNLID
ncbi:MAG: M23 family metallopeptidase [Pseudomonadota bacterium]|nr:M23 family metallopeptidase [Pseudomonadota bacterium]